MTGLKGLIYATGSVCVRVLLAKPLIEVVSLMLKELIKPSAILSNSLNIWFTHYISLFRTVCAIGPPDRELLEANTIIPQHDKHELVSSA